MKILYDHQIFSSQTKGGISRYFYELISKSFSNGINVDIPEMYSDNQYVLDSAVFKIKKPPNINFRGKQIILNKINQITSVKTLKKGDYDIFHPTYYSPYFTKYLKKPYVLTVYDMIHEIYPQYFKKYDFTQKNKEIMIKNASSIIAISDTTKKDILKYYDIDDDNITVIYLGNSLTRVESPITHDYNYILYVGNRHGYKNFKSFVMSICEILKNNDLRLICFGGGRFTTSESKLFADMGIQNKLSQISGSDRELITYYNNAVAFVMPSLYEGFGIPVLEAFSCNCPVVLSNTGSLPEIGGEAAIYFDPFDSKDIAEKVSEIISNEKLRLKLKKRGTSRLSLFNWEKTAKLTKNKYEELL
jgi:glycosyltransferase involved in cell wall biosynthesis